MDGILNINKATGMTSHDVVAKIRKLLQQKRVGHAGTLDPAASGVLPICLGQATRVAEYLSESGKAYQAEIILGISTDTYDSEGTITSSKGVMNHALAVDLAQIKQTLQQFLGPQMQIPPPYSAIKIQGQPAYKRARAGESITLQPRPVTIYQLEILQWLPPRLTLATECSKGTYIRSLAHDLGEQLGCGAHLAALQRTRSGPFSLSDSITLEQLEQANAEGTIQHYLHPTDTALQQYPAFILDEGTIQHVLHGNAFTYNAQPGHTPTDLARVYDIVGHFHAIAAWDAERNMWQPKKVFSSLLLA
jgi:tRNA pseudouridine55 synthase